MLSQFEEEKVSSSYQVYPLFDLSHELVLPQINEDIEVEEQDES